MPCSAGILSNPKFIAAAIFFGLFYLVVRTYRNVTLQRNEKMLRNWLRSSGFELIQLEYDWVEPGPFFYSTVFLGAFDQAVYRVIAAKDGWEYRGWARVRGRITGLIGEPVRVVWDWEPRHDKPDDERERE